MLDDPQNWSILLGIIGAISGIFGTWVIVEFLWEIYYSEKKHNPVSGIRDTQIDHGDASHRLQKMLLNHHRKTAHRRSSDDNQSINQSIK